MAWEKWGRRCNVPDGVITPHCLSTSTGPFGFTTFGFASSFFFFIFGAFSPSPSAFLFFPFDTATAALPALFFAPFFKLTFPPPPAPPSPASTSPSPSSSSSSSSPTTEFESAFSFSIVLAFVSFSSALFFLTLSFLSVVVDAALLLPLHFLVCSARALARKERLHDGQICRSGLSSIGRPVSKDSRTLSESWFTTGPGEATEAGVGVARAFLFSVDQRS